MSYAKRAVIHSYRRFKENPTRKNRLAYINAIQFYRQNTEERG
jgi:hypothetical protein